jgi:hypothetical protein
MRTNTTIPMFADVAVAAKKLQRVRKIVIYDPAV